MSHPLKHFILVCRHRNQVIKNGFHLGFFFSFLTHDLSKFRPSEFITSSRYYRGDGSPIYNERMANNYYSKVCQLHTRRNKHHWEYYTDFLVGRIIVRNIPYRYCMEYIADVISASMTYNRKSFKRNMPYDYFMFVKESYYMTKATEEFLSKCFLSYRDSGFKHLKKKDTKKMYQKITSSLPDVEIFEEMKTSRKLPEIKK